MKRRKQLSRRSSRLKKKATPECVFRNVLRAGRSLALLHLMLMSDEQKKNLLIAMTGPYSFAVPAEKNGG